VHENAVRILGSMTDDIRAQLTAMAEELAQ